MLAADFNDDGALDLAVGDRFGGPLCIILGDGEGGFRAPTTYPTDDTQEAFDIGDINGDGVVDLAITNTNDGVLSTFLGDGSGRFDPASEIDLPDPYRRPGAGRLRR